MIKYIKEPLYVVNKWKHSSRKCNRDLEEEKKSWRIYKMHEAENEIFDDYASNKISFNNLVKMKNEKEIMEIINKELFEYLLIEKQEEMVLNQINMLNIHENDSNGKEYITYAEMAQVM